MIYKEILCPTCNGCGHITGWDENSIWSTTCSNCNGRQTITTPMTNGDIIRICSNEQLLKVYYNLQNTALYSGGDNNRLLSNSQEDFLLWLNKEADDVDIASIFDFIYDENDPGNQYNKYHSLD